jgi:beta-lactamase regulating signal transducer with metallopeptidase domain
MNVSIESLLMSLWRASWQASLLGAMVLLIQWILRGQLSARARFALWAIVVARLFLPTLPEARWSLFNLYGQPESAEVVASPTMNEPQGRLVVIEPNDNEAMQAPEGWTLASILPWIAIAWVVGIAVLLTRVLATCMGLSRLMRPMVPCGQDHVLKLVKAACQELQLRRSPRILVGESIQTPALVGVFRPALLLPTSVIKRCDPATLRLILLHELAHLARRDILINWLITYATVLHWFNPFVWFLASRMRADRELACDETVLSLRGGDEKLAYGQTLIQLIEILSPAARTPRQMVGILETSTPMKRRVRMIAKFDARRSKQWLLAALIVAGLGSVALTDRVTAQQRPTAPANTPATRPANAGEQLAGQERQVATDRSIEEALNRVLPEIRFDQVPLGDVIEFLRDVSSQNIVVRWRNLEAAGIDQSAKVSLNLRNVTLGQALSHTLEDAGGGAVNIGFQIQSGAIVIAEAAGASKLETVTYDVARLLPRADRDQYGAKLCSVIKSSINAEIPSVNFFGTKIVVLANSDTQRKVETLLKNLSADPLATPTAQSVPEYKP